MSAYTKATMPNWASAPLDEAGRWTIEWQMFLQAIFNRTGGAGSPIDINTLQQQDEISQDVPPQNAATMSALRGVEELWSEQRVPENMSAVYARLSDLEAIIQTGIDLGPVFQKLSDLEAAIQIGVDLGPVFQRLSDLEAAQADYRLPPTQINEQWNAPVFANAWANLAAPNNPAGYWKDSFGVVHLRGGIQSGTINTAAFTLPIGYRPNNTEVFAVTSNGAFGSVSVSSAGAVTPTVGSNVSVYLDGLTFRAA